MCGLVGAAGPLGHKHESAFKCLLELDTSRGPHSTGVYVVKAGGNSLIKDVGTPWDLYQHYQFKQAMAGCIKLLMGHNRWATRGGVSKHTAHPFEFETLVGCHNGTLTRQELLKDSHLFSVDSENLYYHMESKGLDDTLTNTDGAFALTWYNKADKTLNFIRNSERELFFTFSEGVLFWASEKWMLTVALSKGGLKHGEIVPFEERMHYLIDIPSSGALGKFVVRDKTGFQPKKLYATKVAGYFGGHISTATQKATTNFTIDYFKGVYSVRICSFVAGGEKGIYFVGLINDDPALKVRLYADILHEKHDLIRKNLNAFMHMSFRSKRSEGVDEYYVADLRTVEEIVTTPPPKQKLYRWRNHFLSRESVEAHLDQGHECVWCSSRITLKDLEDCVFLEYPQTQIVCGGCKNLEEVTPYIN